MKTDMASLYIFFCLCEFCKLVPTILCMLAAVGLTSPRSLLCSFRMVCFSNADRPVWEKTGPSGERRKRKRQNISAAAAATVDESSNLPHLTVFACFTNFYMGLKGEVTDYRNPSSLFSSRFAHQPGSP